MKRRADGGAPTSSGQVVPHPTVARERQNNPRPDPWQRLGDVAARVVRARLVEHLHALGPRATFEFINEIARAHEIGAEVDALLETYGELDPQIVAALGAHDIPPIPLHEVNRDRDLICCSLGWSLRRSLKFF